ncbi:MAG: DEAD/DEAH box helicase, partial [Bacteroidia bacterium]
MKYIVDCHAVQLLSNGEMSMTHQPITQGNYEDFKCGMDKVDEQIVQLILEISRKNIIQKFGGDVNKQVDFFESRFKLVNEKLSLVATQILGFVEKRLAQIFPLLVEHNKRLYEQDNEGYPIKRAIQLLKEKASVIFHFTRNEEGTVYYPTIKLKEGLLGNFQNKKPSLLCMQPAWMLVGGELFTFEHNVEGIKIQPFLMKYNIQVPKEKEEEYYRKFVAQIIEKYPVKPKGFVIKEIETAPHFTLKVKVNDTSISLIKSVSYYHHHFLMEDDKPFSSVFEKFGEQYIFYKITRNQVLENKIKAFYEENIPNKTSLMPWENLEKSRAFDWLLQKVDALQELNIEIVQPNREHQFHFDTPKVSVNLEADGDWFDVQAVVSIGKYQIPFIQFKNHILRGKREYVLPDGTIALLPSTWFSDYRHLMEVAVQEGHSLKVKNYQAAIVEDAFEIKTTSNQLIFKPIEEIPATELPQGLKATLRSYQQKGLDWLWYMKENKVGAILADDMGLGKTLQTISLLLKAKEVGEKGTSLIVLPTSLVYNWQNEAKKFAPTLSVSVHTGFHRAKTPTFFSGYDVILSTYGVVRQDAEMLKQFSFYYLILDESQVIKNPESKTAQAVKSLISKYRLSLTGTPIENTIVDVWSQMDFLNPGLLGNEAFFKKHYVTPIEKNKSEKDALKLRKIIFPYILRRKKSQVEKELPEKVENLHYCEMEEAQQKLYEENRDIYRAYLMDLLAQGSFKKNKLNVLAGLQKLRQIAIHPQMIEKSAELEDSGKYLEIKRLLTEIIAKESKVLIFSQFVKMLQILKED